MMLERLLICAVCGWLAGCAWMEDPTGLSDGLGRSFEGLAEAARGVKDVGAAAAVGGRVLEGTKRKIDSAVDMAALSSMLPGRAPAPAATCGPAAEGRESAIRGDFAGSGTRTRLFLSPGCRIRHEDGPASAFVGAPDSVSFEALCRDPVSGRDRAVFLVSRGASSAVEVWGVDPPSGAPKPLYAERSGNRESGDAGRRKPDRLVAADGTCLRRSGPEPRGREVRRGPAPRRR